MDWPKLDTRWWNLSLGVVATTAMSACGPTIMLDDEDSITDSDTDGPDTTNPPDTTEPPPGSCQISSDCEPGQVCIDNVCMPYEYYCQDGGCCYDGCCYEDCCYGDCYWQECYSDEECGIGELCNYGNCEAVDSLPACEEPSLAPLLLPIEDEDPIVSLSFVDGNGDEAQDLLVGRTGGARLHMADQALDLPLPPGSEVVVDAVSADLDGDGNPDLVVTDGDHSLTVLLGDGAGGYALGSVVDMGTGITDLMALHWDSDGAVDLAGLTSIGTVMVHQGDGAGGLMASYTLHGDGDNISLATGRFNGDELGDLVAQDTDETMLFFGNDAANVSIAGSLPELETWTSYPSGRQLLAGDIDGSGLSEIIGRSNRWGGWLLLEAWPNGGEDIPQRYAIYDEADHAAMGDYDGDGYLDVVTATSDRLMFVRGTGLPQIFGCQAEASIGSLIEHLALGDYDGDGRAELVVSSGPTLQVFVVE